MKIDIVYTWFDGNDSAWKAKRSNCSPIVEREAEDFSCEARVVSSDELKYSLRSVEMYAPWVNRIYIVTDNQIPEWINVNHKKIEIVDHKDILPANALPIFNSNAIEQGIVNIKGLSEQFLYSNDDTFFGRTASQDFFFTKDGKPICRMAIPSKKLENSMLKPDATSYCKIIVASNRKISKDFDENYEKLLPHHQIDAYSRTSILECLDKYNEWSNKTINNRFRSDDDMQRHIFSLYAVANNQGLLNINTITKRKFHKILSMLRLIKGVDSCTFSLNQKHIKFSIKHFRPQLTCFNDSEFVNDDDRKHCMQIIKELYPNKSSFEL